MSGFIIFVVETFRPFSFFPCLFVAVSGVAVQNDYVLAKDDATPIVIMIPGLTSDSASPVS